MLNREERPVSIQLHLCLIADLCLIKGDATGKPNSGICNESWVSLWWTATKNSGFVLFYPDFGICSQKKVLLQFTIKITKMIKSWNIYSSFYEVRVKLATKRWEENLCGHRVIFIVRDYSNYFIRKCFHLKYELVIW